MAKQEESSLWGAYYRAVAGRPPREFLRDTAKRFPGPGLAVDLGCGNGIDSLFLLMQGWRVLAIDQEEEAIEFLRRQVPPTATPFLQTMTASFAEAELPPADLIWAGYSLPFCPPERFDRLWQKIVGALKANGRFAGDFFGPRHAWVGENEMTFHTREDILNLCQGLHLEYIMEGEGEVQTGQSDLEKWHMFTICARK